MDEKKLVLTDLKDSLAESIEVYNNCTAGSKERAQEAENVEKIAKALSDLKSTESDILDKEERRRIEEEKNAANAEIESEKARTPWARIIFEAAVKVCMQFVDHGFFVRNQRQVLDFEEHGIVRSKASKDLGFRFPWSKK